MTEVILAGTFMGLASGLHCLGMCGPIVASFPPSGGSLSVLLDPYHLARISVYGILGVISGLIGSLFSLGGLHLFAGIAFLLLLFVGLTFMLKGTMDFGFTGHTFFKKLWGKALKTGGFTGRMTLGALNGLLPCGMVYFALATAIAWGSLGESVMFMLTFGLGTLPLLLMIPLAGKMIPPTWRTKLKPLQPILFIGSILIVLWRVVIIPLDLLSFLPWIESTPMCT